MTVCQIDKANSVLQRRNTRPWLGFFIGPYYPLHRYRGSKTLPDGLFEAHQIDARAYLEDHARLHALHAACPGDHLWTATAFWGVPWMEAALGCPVEADHHTGSSRSRRPLTEGWPGVPEFSPDNPWVAKCLEMLRVVTAQAQGRYPTGATLMRGISDLLSALLGLDQLIYTMLDDPARVHALAEQITDFWIAFGHAQLDACAPFDGGYGSFSYNLWAPGRCLWLQEDAAALLSPDLFEEFILPYDRRIAQAFAYTYIHLHPARYIPYRPLLDTDLAVIELHIDKGGPSARDLLPVYREIQSRKPLYIWGDVSAEDLRTCLTELDPEGLAIEMVVPDIEEAKRLYDLYHTLT
jgi:hypothetical protein